MRLTHGSGAGQWFEWTKAGRLSGAVDDVHRLRFERDGEGRTTLETQNEYAVRSTYDASGNRVALSSTAGLSMRIERDVLGRAVSLHATQGARTLTLQFKRDACGRERVRHLPGPLQLAWQHDALGRPIERVLSQGERVLDSSRYSWRGVDRLARMEDSQRGTIEFVHDSRARLVAARMGRGGLERALDDTGNAYRVRSRDDHRYGPGGRLEEAYGTEYGYDLEGRRLEKATPLGDSIRYHWDVLGRLVSVTLSTDSRVVYGYDALGRRVSRCLERRVEVPGLDEPLWDRLRETRYIWDGLTLLHEIEGGDVTTWLWEGGLLLGKLTTRGAFAVLTDHLGMPTELIDDAGSLAWRGDVDLFGVLQRDLANEPCPWRFPGHWEDPDTGLQHSLFRVYDPETAAYLSPSPLGIAGGPNLYAYLPDPMSETSPLGLGRGYAALCGELKAERLSSELVEIAIRALDRDDGATGPRERFDARAARVCLPGPEADWWGPWARYRPGFPRTANSSPRHVP